ncbi:hypothetical protein [Jeotgalibaca ciconiae]|uniref:Lipoprotein n=1 Tax=Jeotgalibaca ciconiae TaxID=2496265 RepID=A0A3Q9BMG5_9LACT|nr:hypothetical protein [Jeotgalibaca ciconiae]AZP05573.1 hypothetical protein EJN90_13555 [Jeotgalibaca ciconiae]HJB24642.1 hypothetical protein [Candidatus Jeotgalibaca pullicola]
MTLASYKQLIALGFSGLLLASCSTEVPENSAESDSISEEIQSQETSNEESIGSEESSVSEELESEEIESESQNSTDDIRSQFEMEDEYVLLPRYFPGFTTPTGVDIISNNPDIYDVVYRNEDGNQQIEVLSRIYDSQDGALQNIEEVINGSVAVPENEESAYDLGYGITGYGEAGAGNFYFGWEEGNWTFTIHSHLQDDWDVHGIATRMVEYLEENYLPAPSQRGTMYIDYPEKDRDPEVHVLWNVDNRVYEVSTVSTPIEAMDSIISME